MSNATIAPDSVQASIAPLVQLLQQELTIAGIRLSQAQPTSIEAFTLWYLEVVQKLEVHIAREGERPAITRSEVELMCRCALSARRLDEAIELCTRYSAMLYPRAGRPGLDVAGGVASFRLDSLRQETTTASSLVDITGLFAFNQLFQWLVGADLQLLQVRIGPVQRDDVLPFLQLFKAPVLAGGDTYALEFPREVLNMPVVRSAGEFTTFFKLFPCGVFEVNTHDLAQQVAALLTAAARQGGGIPSQESLASTMGVPLSTFRRRLFHSGASFRQLRENSLKESAMGLLRRGDLSITEIAGRLGFSDTGAFRRAFRQWLGMSPTAWRQQQDL
jgi:AraC-like DNA-binding protein